MKKPYDSREYRSEVEHLGVTLGGSSTHRLWVIHLLTLSPRNPASLPWHSPQLQKCATACEIKTKGILLCEKSTESHVYRLGADTDFEPPQSIFTHRLREGTYLECSMAKAQQWVRPSGQLDDTDSSGGWATPPPLFGVWVLLLRSLNRTLSGSKPKTACLSYSGHWFA